MQDFHNFLFEPWQVENCLLLCLVSVLTTQSTPYLAGLASVSSAACLIICSAAILIFFKITVAQMQEDAQKTEED